MDSKPDADMRSLQKEVSLTVLRDKKPLQFTDEKLY